MIGARAGRPAWLRRLVARAAARELTAFIVPGLEIARAYGLDPAAAGLHPVDNPRHASILLLVGELPAGLRRAAAVSYAQMPRPRAIIALGAADVTPLPAPDVALPLVQEALAAGVGAVRQRFADASFNRTVADFDVAAVRTETKYTCPMHPEIVRDEPGQCPICGMDLVPQEQTGMPSEHGGMAMDAGAVQSGEQGEHVGTYTCPMHPEISQDHPGQCPICGMKLVPREDAGRTAGHDSAAGDHEATHEGKQAGGAGTYTCPMHPEVVQDEPGQCPICEMALVPRERVDQEQATAPHRAHYDHGDAARASDAGSNHASQQHAVGHEADDAGHQHEQGQRHVEGRGHAAMPHDAHEAMDHGPVEHGTHGDHEAHGDMAHLDHGDMADMSHNGSGQDMEDTAGMNHGTHAGGGFMSMVAMTKDLPRSADGLPMEWVETPFGPLSPGLPGGLALMLTLDGDAVAQAKVTPGATGRGLATTWSGPVATLPERLARLDPLAPVAYRLLALRALVDVAGSVPSEAAARAWVGALERERAASHLNWLAAFAHLLGIRWLEEGAAALHHTLRDAPDAAAVARLRPPMRAFVRRARRIPLLRRRLAGIGALASSTAKHRRGPVARAAGEDVDARAGDPAYRALGFTPVRCAGDDAWARLWVRLAEIEQSLDLVVAAGALVLLSAPAPLPAQGEGMATVETPRGAATLHLTIEESRATARHLDTPSAALVGLVEPVAVGREVADALLGVASLDLSPWEMDR